MKEDPPSTSPINKLYKYSPLWLYHMPLGLNYNFTNGLAQATQHKQA